MDDQQITDLERRGERLEDALRTFTSSPQDDEIGSKQRAFKGMTLVGKGNVSRITLGDDGVTLSVEKVR